MDDVLYLKQHADEESFQFVVDSARRDTAVYPEPHEYEVQFNAPFRNVVGLDLIDATLPRTEYLVESGADTLVFALDGDPTRRTVEVAPGDYNILQLAEALNVALAAAVEPDGAFMAVRPTTTPAELANRVRVVADRPFVVHAAESGLRRALGLGHRTTLAAAAQAEPGVLGTSTVVQGPLPATDVADASVPCRQPLALERAGRLTEVRVYVSASQPGAVVRAAVVADDDGSLVAEGWAAASTPDFQELAVQLVSLAPVQPGRAYHLVLQSAAAGVYAGGPSVSHAAGEGPEWWSPASWADGPDDSPLCASVEMELDGYALDPPGVVDLTGESYVLVRCPEIEQQLYRDRAFETVHAGMGLVKLGNYGFREQRFDFVSFPPRRLPTPIGKLPKLTIRLETGGGRPYDTKGVDHHLVFVIRYLEMTKGPESMTSTLNPGYQPNPLLYLQSQHRRQAQP